MKLSPELPLFPEQDYGGWRHASRHAVSKR
jgi:hypothetical protein